MKFNNLAEALITCSELSSEQEGFRFLDDKGNEEGFLSFKDLLVTVRQLAFSLKNEGLKKGDCVGIIIPEQRDFIQVFYSCLWLGLVPVPMAPPVQLNMLEYYTKSLIKTAGTAGISQFIVSPKLKPFLGSLLSAGVKRISTLKEYNLTDSLIAHVPTFENDIAFLQFTSGSTSDPKGVIVTNGNIMANTKCIAESGMNLSREDTFFSWLPFYHDMGLIGFVITPVIYQCSGTFISPLAFIKRPSVWLKGMTKYGATISFAPNFAYGLCVKRIKDEELAEIDLTKWRMAGCGAEPVQVSTVENFISKFSKCGFNSRKFKACYGMAESTLAVSFPSMTEDIKVDDWQSEDKVTLRNISCGKAFPDHEISVRRPDDTVCCERETGEVAIKGPSVTRGYINNPAATQAVIRDGWLYTGDYGYLSSGEIFICGRKKDLIIISGRNYYPADIESVVSGLYGVRTGNVVAFSYSKENADSLVICAEKNNLEQLEQTALIKNIKDEINGIFGLVAAEVKILNPGSLPKTSSGKLQRSKAKELYLSGKLTDSVKAKNFSIIMHTGVIWLKSKLHYIRNFQA